MEKLEVIESYKGQVYCHANWYPAKYEPPTIVTVGTAEPGDFVVELVADNPNPLPEITDFEHIRVVKSKDTYWLSKGQIKACDKYREGIDQLWISMCGGHNQNHLHYTRRLLFHESTRVVKFINENKEHTLKK